MVKNYFIAKIIFFVLHLIDEQLRMEKEEYKLCGGLERQEDIGIKHTWWFYMRHPTKL